MRLSFRIIFPLKFITQSTALILQLKWMSLSAGRTTTLQIPGAKDRSTEWVCTGVLNILVTFHTLNVLLVQYQQLYVPTRVSVIKCVLWGSSNLHVTQTTLLQFPMWRWLMVTNISFAFLQICSEMEHVTVLSGEQPVHYSNLHHHLSCIRWNMAVLKQMAYNNCLPFNIAENYYLILICYPQRRVWNQASSLGNHCPHQCSVRNETKNLQVVWIITFLGACNMLKIKKRFNMYLPDNFTKFITETSHCTHQP